MFREGLKVIPRNDFLSSDHGMARGLEVPYRMITTRKNKLTSRLEQARLGSCMETVMRVAERAALKIQ